MKKAIYAAAIMVLAAMPAMAVPKILNYQGFLTESGSPVTGTRDMNFRVFAAPTGGAALFTEVHGGANTVTVTNGNFSVLVGELTAGGIPVAVFDGGDRYMEVEVGAVILPRQRIVSVAYSIRSETASAVRPMLRFTRAKLASTDGDVNKEAQCVSELGDGYAAAVLPEIMALTGSGQTPQGSDIFFTFAVTSDLWEYADDGSFAAQMKRRSDISGSGQIACVNRAAPVRSTRATVAAGDSGAAKDAQCAVEFGGDYVAATVLDFTAGIRGSYADSDNNSVMVFAGDNRVFTTQTGYGTVMLREFNRPLPAYVPLICIRR